MQLWGPKTESWFDIWSIEHFIAGITVGFLVKALISGSPFRGMRRPRVDDAAVWLLAVLTLSYLWEAVEHYLEAGATGIAAVTYWFQGVEYWGNRLLADPLLFVLGATISRLQPRPVIRILAFGFSATWVVLHVVVLPHSMWLHNYLAERVFQ